MTARRFSGVARTRSWMMPFLISAFVFCIVQKLPGMCALPRKVVPAPCTGTTCIGLRTGPGLPCGEKRDRGTAKRMQDQHRSSGLTSLLSLFVREFWYKQEIQQTDTGLYSMNFCENRVTFCLPSGPFSCKGPVRAATIVRGPLSNGQSLRTSSRYRLRRKSRPTLPQCRKIKSIQVLVSYWRISDEQRVCFLRQDPSGG